MARFSEQLRDEFYRWESIGRGEKLWAESVSPEPHFVPFFFHGAFLDSTPPKDTGLRPNLLDRGKNLFKRTKKSEQNPESISHLLEALESEFPPDHIANLRGAEGLSEFKILLPEDQRLDQNRLEQLFYSLSSFDHALTFEIIAVENEIQIQFAMDHSDAVRFAELFTAFFPEVELEYVDEGYLLDAIFELTEGEVISRDLALSHEFFYPIKRLKEMSIDPYQALLGLLGNLGKSELVAFQVTFAPCLNAWGKSISELVQGESGRPFFETRPEDLRAAMDKTSTPLFGVTVRLSGLAPSIHRCRELLRPVAGSLEALQGQNGFVLASEQDELPNIATMTEIGIRSSRRSGMILNGNELMSLVHFPQPDIHVPKLARKRAITRELPEEIIRPQGLVLGTSHESSGSVEVTLSPTERLKHMHLIGASGTGKSTFIANSIVQDLEAGHGIALLDPHGDLVEQVLCQIPEHRLEDVIIFDPADAEFPVGFNMLTARSEAEKNLLASDFVSIIQRLSSSWGDNMTSILGNAVMAFLESPRGGTLLDLRRFLNEDHFRTEYLESVTEPEVRYFWTHEFPLVRGSAQASLVTRLGSYIRQKLLRNMVAQKEEQLDFADMLNSGKIFLAPLAQGRIGEECSFLLGSTLVSKFYQTALTRQEMDESERKPFFLYVDEAHNFVTPSIGSILSGSRKYGLGLILAHQDLDQFRSRSPATLSSILTNAHTRICFKLGDQDARKLEEGFEHFGPQDLRVLGRGEALCRVGGSQNDFLLKTSPPLPIPEDAESRTREIVRYSQAKYGTPIAQVEKEMEAYYSAPLPAKKSAKKKSATSKKKEEVKKIPETDEPTPVQTPLEGSPAETEKPEKVTPPPSEEAPPNTEKDENRAPISTQPVTPEVSQEALDKARPYESVKKGQSPGRGGPVHKAIQGQVKALATGLGLVAQIEAALPKGGGHVDVLLEAKTKKIAIEIALQSPISQEVKNISKCLNQVFTEVIVVSDEAQHLREIRQAARDAQLGPQLDSVKFLSTTQLGEFLSEFVASLSSTETENLGYTVKTNFVSKSDKEVQDRKKRILDMVAETRRKMSEKRSEDESES